MHRAGTDWSLELPLDRYLCEGTEPVKEMVVVAVASAPGGITATLALLPLIGENSARHSARLLERAVGPRAPLHNCPLLP